MFFSASAVEFRFLQSENELNLVVFLFFCLFVFSLSGKVFPVAPLLSGVFVHRIFCAYFGRFQGVVEMPRFLWWTH